MTLDTAALVWAVAGFFGTLAIAGQAGREPDPLIIAGAILFGVIVGPLTLLVVSAIWLVENRHLLTQWIR